MTATQLQRSFFALSMGMLILFSALPARAGDEGPADKGYVIGAEDVLDIKVWKNEDLNRILEVSKDGAVTFPFIGKIQAAGLTVFQFEKLLQDKLGHGYLVAPQVTVTMSQYKSQKVYVLGEVRKPGSVVVKGRAHLLDAISEAGGLTDNAGRTVTIVRPGAGSRRPESESPLPPGAAGQDTIQVDLTDQLTISSEKRDDLIIRGGESIYVAKASRVYVTGEVEKPGEVKWEKGITLHQALSLAGGATRRGAPNRTKVIRAQDGKETELKLKMSDPVLPDDIIKVPQSYF